MNVKQPDKSRGNIVFIFVIVLGYALGLLIKRVHIGLIIGLAIGLLATGTLRKR